MKSNEQILERFLSPDSIDFFNTQRTLLISFLPLDMARDYLNPEYVKLCDEGTIPEDEKWNNLSVDPQKELLEFLPVLYKLLDRDNIVETTKGLLLVKTLIWVLDDGFYEEIEPFYQETVLDNAEDTLRKINKRYGYHPTIETIAFEEIHEEGSIGPDSSHNA